MVDAAAFEFVFALLKTLRETILDLQKSGPVPQTSIWMALQSTHPTLFNDLENFNKLVMVAEKLELFKRGPNHTFVAE